MCGAVQIDWSGVVSLGDVIGAGLGALLGFIFAWFLGRLEATSRHRSELRSCFRHVVQLFNEALSGWQRTVTDMEPVADSYKRQWYRLHNTPILLIVSAKSLRSMDRIQLREAFMLHFGSREGHIQHGRLLGLLDVFDTLNSQLLDELQGRTRDIQNRTENFSHTAHDVRLLLLAHLATSQAQGVIDLTSQELNRINMILQARQESADELMVPQVLETFIEPLLSLGNRQGINVQQILPILTTASRARQLADRIQTCGQEIGIVIERHVAAMKHHLADADELLKLLRK